MPPWFWTLSAALASAASVASTLAEAARRIDARPPLHREAVRRGGEIASRPAAEDEEAPGRARVGHAAGDTRETCAVAERIRGVVDEGHAQLAREYRRERGRPGERVRRQDRPEPGARGERAAELDEEEHLLRSAVARPARGLGQAEAEPAEPAR